MDASTADDAPREARANRLYWDSDASVNDIADTLDISKGALYGMVHPRPAGFSCPECGDEMEYPNRTARAKGFVHCPTCGLEEEEDVVLEAGAPEAAGQGAPTDDERAARQRLVWGGALLGAAAGLLLLRWARR
jgi:predicted RNA-binding Zn-ribbon protein involved in translation (DUF1610 family)